MNGQVSPRAAFRRLAGAILVLALAVPAARAANGRITFSGVVSAPTCATAVQRVEQSLKPRAQVQIPGHCHDSQTRQPDQARAFDLQVTAMPDTMVDARVSTYFRHFAAAGNTLLATQTYR